MNNEKTIVTNTMDLNEISLEQALIDFEVANARVVDLTGRLTSLSKELLQTKTELATVKLRNSVPAGGAPYQGSSIQNYEGVENLRDTVRQLRASRAVRAASLFSSKLRKVLAQ